MSEREPVRVDGWAPIGAYGIIGDGRSVALIADDGRIDWWPLPALDSPPVFAALLDPPQGGYLELRSETHVTVSRRYLAGTNVRQTDFATAEGQVRVTDALAVGRAGGLPWTELIRRIEGRRFGSHGLHRSAVQRELADGPLVYRYTGMQGSEGAFVGCSFWIQSGDEPER